MSITSNLRSYWESATAEHRREGRAWYSNARSLVVALASEFGTTIARVAGIVAATSPRLPWRRNVEVTRELLAGRDVRGVFRTSVDKARAIIAGARPMAVLGGNKVRAFYRALLGDRRAAVIDTWMVRAAGLNPLATLSDAMYARLARALERVASELRIAVAELQGVVWVAIRGRAD